MEEETQVACPRTDSGSIYHKWDSIPAEIKDFILLLAVRDDIYTIFVLPFVCRDWRDRKSFWQPSPSSLPRTSPTTQILPTIAGTGNLSLLKWFWGLGCRGDATACASAAAEGHLEVLKWLRGQGCAWNESACVSAASGGHLEVLKWLREQRCPLPELAWAQALSYGHLEVVQWLREQKCPWNATACNAAALKCCSG